MAAKKKGLSLEEKVARVEDFFAERQVPFTMKELETSIPKAKGVIYQSVAECVNLLVSENRVHSEKVGVMLLFWHFSATATNNLVQTNERMEKGIASAEASVAALTARAAVLQVQKDCGAERHELEGLLNAEKCLAKQLQLAVNSASECDVVTYDGVRGAAVRCRDLANKWTDNIFVLEARAKRRMGLGAVDFRRMLQLPSDFDYIGLSV